MEDRWRRIGGGRGHDLISHSYLRQDASMLHRVGFGGLGFLISQYLPDGVNQRPGNETLLTLSNV